MIPDRKRLRVWGFVAIVVGCMLFTPLYSLVGAAIAQDEEGGVFVETAML